MLSISKKNGEISVVIGLLAVSLFLVLTAYRMPLGTAVMPGPGVMPFAIGLVLGVTATALLFSVLKRHGKTVDVVQLGSRHIFVAVSGLIWVSLLFEGLGFSLCLGVFLLALSREFSRQGWLKPLAFAVLAVAGAYGFFVYLLDVSMPRGLL